MLYKPIRIQWKKMKINLTNPTIQKNLLKGQFGLEKENIRINNKGELSQEKHPFTNNPQIDRDFSESQIELITKPHNTTKETLNDLTQLQKQTAEKLLQLKTGEEYLWPFSNPPKITENQIKIAQYTGDKKEKTIYRQYLAKKYGKKKMLYSGIHYNFSFSQTLIKTLYKTENNNKKNYTQFKNNIYLELSKKVTKYTWLIVYLTAASPIIDQSLLTNNIQTEYASYRCSEYGYWNYFTPILNYTSFEKYIKSINQYLKDGLIYSTAELYYPVRLKCPGKNNLYKLENCGIDHIELRMLDLNPLYEEGISFKDIEFLHYLLIYFLSLPNINFDAESQKNALENEKNASKLHEEDITIKIDNKKINIVKAGLQVLNEMENFYKKLDNKKILENINYQKNKFLKPKERYAYQVKNLFENEYMEKGIILAKEHAVFNANQN